MNELDQKPTWGADNNAVIAIVAVNLSIAAALAFFKVTYYLEGFPAMDYQNEIYQNVIFVPENLKNTPWTLFTFYWTHDNFWTLFTNLFWLMIFGNILQSNQSNKHIFPIYLYSGLLAGITYIIHKGAVPFLGAQTGVFALAIAACVIAPTYKVVPNIGKGIPVWVLALAYFTLTLFSFTQTNIILNFSVVLGGLMGLIYTLLLKKEIDLGKWMHQLLRWLNNTYQPKK